MTPISIAGGLLLGVIIGIISGLIGIGGGAFLIPALIYFYGMSQIKAQGTSLGTLLLPIGVFAFWTYYKAGYVDVRLALLIAAGIRNPVDCVGRKATCNEVILIPLTVVQRWCAKARFGRREMTDTTYEIFPARALP